jgi:large subunit ribosomal protein L14
MLQKETVFSIVDNTGARSARCIFTGKGFRNRYARLGGIVNITIQNYRKYKRTTKKLERKKIYQALIIGTRKKYRRQNGIFINFDQNRGVLLHDFKILGKRLYGPVTKEMRNKP